MDICDRGRLVPASARAGGAAGTCGFARACCPSPTPRASPAHDSYLTGVLECLPSACRRVVMIGSQYWFYCLEQQLRNVPLPPG